MRPRKDYTGWRFALLFAVAVALSLLAGSCRTSYLGQAISGHMKIMRSRQPIEKILGQENLDPQFRQKLQMVIDVQTFARKELALPESRSYTVFSQIETDYPGWNVYCAPKFSTRPKTWCYPVAGCVVYHGYFKKELAERFAGKMIAEGYDVYMAPFTGYSTLGWFRDPLLSSQLKYDSVSLAGLIIHELAHERYYRAGDSEFSESFAVTVERNGVLRWLNSLGSTDLIENLVNEWKMEDQKVERMLRVKDKLNQLYASKADTSLMQQKKDSILLQLAHDLGIKNRKLNNAFLIPISTYHSGIPAFQHLFDSVGGDFIRFYDLVEGLSK